MRISDWSSDVCSSDLIGWQYEGAAERVHRHILLDRCHLNAGQMTFLRAHQIQRRLQPRLLAAVPVDVQQDRFHGISPFPWKRSLGLCWLSLITHGYRCKFRGAVEPNRICRQPVRTDGKFSCLRQMALLLTVPVNGSPGERAYARADKGARGPVAIAPDDQIGRAHV